MSEFGQHSGARTRTNGEAKFDKSTPSYSETDVNDVRHFVDDATKLLDKLHLDLRSGISRNTLTKAETNKNLSKHDLQVLDGLLALEPSIQDAWQVPNHRQHLQAISEAKFEHAFDRKFTVSRADAAKLNSDRAKQTAVYFGRADVNPATFAELKSQAAHVEAALLFVEGTHNADVMLQKFQHQSRDGFTSQEIQAALSSTKATDIDKVMLHAMNDYLKSVQIDDPNQSAAARRLLNRDEIAASLSEWAVKEVKPGRENPETLFVSEIEGYSGGGLKNIKRDRFNREMDYKDAGQLEDYDRSHNFKSFPHHKS
jgi:hypothetical protein